MQTAVLIAHVYVIYLVIAEPYLGKRMYQALERDVGANPNARIRFYRQLVALAWLGMPVVAIFAWLYPTGIADLGFRWPQAGLWGWVIAAGISTLVLVQTAVMTIFRERLAQDPKTLAAMRHVWHMLPRSDPDQRWWTGVSWTAGICEEVVYRGFLFFYLQQIWGLPIITAVVLSSAVFGLAHIYQGPRPAAMTAVVALVMGAIYAATGSLLLPIVLHTIIDWRTLVFVPLVRQADREDQAGQGVPGQS